MTLVVAAVAANHAFHASDRVVSVEPTPGNPTGEFDPHSNKTVIVVGTDCWVVLGYTGIAYLVRVPGVGLYDTKMIGQPPKRRTDDDSSSDSVHNTSGNAAELPPPGYWNGREWTPPPKPPTNERRLIITCGILGAVLLLIVLANMGGCGDDNEPVASTVTKTVTVTAQPTTVTSTVTVPQAAPPAPFFEPPAIPAAPPATDYPVSPPAPNLPPPPSPNVYYEDCAAARAAGAAPLRRGEPGYSSDLDRDGDGVACESG